jgi:uncharacterized protein
MPPHLPSSTGAERAASARAAPAGAPPAIAHLPSGTTAFVGRTLKGPVNRATRVQGFGEFQQLFGGLWQPATLGYAVEQYFEQGGREAVIVRIANGGRAPSLSLPAGRGELLLRGVSPGTREYLRASVDHDGVPPGDELQFNLVLQRLRAPESELIEDQEIYRLVTVDPESPRSVTRALERSRLMTLAGPLPAQRPDRTTGPAGRTLVGYIAARGDGSDGEPLSDYDLIGDAQAGTGLFALLAGPRFDLLCVPPPVREGNLGAAVLLVAARICRASQAMLVVDPPAEWDTPTAALALAPHWHFHSEEAFMAFPRLLGHDRLRGRNELFAPCGAFAGLLARADASLAPGSPAAGTPPPLRGSLKPRCAISFEERLRLSRLGLNTFDLHRPRPEERLALRSLVGESAGRSSARYVAPRRFALWMQACILEGTRWLLEESASPALWERARAQVAAFLRELADAGCFAGRECEERWFVICDARLNDEQSLAAGRRAVLFGVALQRAGGFQCCLVSHAAAGSSTRAVTLNRLIEPGQHLAEQVETALLRQLVADPALA